MEGFVSSQFISALTAERGIKKEPASASSFLPFNRYCFCQFYLCCLSTRLPLSFGCWADSACAGLFALERCEVVVDELAYLFGFFRVVVLFEYFLKYKQVGECLAQ